MCHMSVPRMPVLRATELALGDMGLSRAPRLSYGCYMTSLWVNLPDILALPSQATYLSGRRKMYNQAVDFWALLVRVLNQMQEMGALGSKRTARFLFAQLWAAHMRFFRQMLMAAKVRARSVLYSTSEDIKLPTCAAARGIAGCRLRDMNCMSHYQIAAYLRRPHALFLPEAARCVLGLFRNCG